MPKTSVDELAPLLQKAFSHLELAKVNDHAVYVMNFKQFFPFHQHTKDELYFVLQGEIILRFRNQPDIVLKANECFVVPAYLSHSSGSEKGALVLMVKPIDMFANAEPDENPQPSDEMPPRQDVPPQPYTE